MVHVLYLAADDADPFVEVYEQRSKAAAAFQAKLDELEAPTDPDLEIFRDRLRMAATMPVTLPPLEMTIAGRRYEGWIREASLVSS